MGASEINTKHPVCSIGHSTRTLKTFLELLTMHSVKRLVDVRTIPRSKRNPHYNQEPLQEALGTAGISYTHLERLGGLRRALAGSRNLAWHNLSFRGFADYMQTTEFTAGLGELIRLAEKETVALMCAEAVPWRCHRTMIADALAIRGIIVKEIISATTSRPHTLTPWARIQGLEIIYPLKALEAVENRNDYRRQSADVQREIRVEKH